MRNTTENKLNGVKGIHVGGLQLIRIYYLSFKYLVEKWQDQLEYLAVTINDACATGHRISNLANKMWTPGNLKTCAKGPYD